MTKIALQNIDNLQNEATTVAAFNNNNALIREAVDNTLSRNGLSPNQMNAPLDMNSNKVINLPDALTEQEPVTLGQMEDTFASFSEGAVVNASFVTVGSNSTLQNERILTGGSNISVTDGGPNSTITLDLPMAANTIKGNNTGVLASAANLSITQIRTMLGLTVKYLTADYGVKTDGSDNYAKINLAIADANSAGGSMVFIVPQGQVTIAGTASLTAITVNKVYFISEAGPGGSWFSVTGNTGNGLFVWGDTTHQPDGGGFLNMGLIGNGSTSQLMIYAPYAARLEFPNLKLSNIGNLCVLGTTTKTVNGIHFQNLNGNVANVTGSLMQLVNGSGFYMDNAQVYSLAGTVGSVVGGRNFIAAFTKGWDTFRVVNSTAEQFDYPIYLEATSGVAINNIELANNYFDQCRNGINLQSDAGGTLYGFAISGTEVNGWNGNGITLNGAGNLVNGSISSNRVLQCANHGIALLGSSKEIIIGQNFVTGVNAAAGAFDGINIATTCSYISLLSNIVGIDESALGVVGQPRYGLNIGNCDSVTITGGVYIGTTANFNIGTLTNSKIKGVRGLADAPTLSVPEGGTGATSLTGVLIGNGASAITASSTLPAAQEPAHTGDVTNSAGSLALAYTNVVPASKGGAGTITGALKANGSGVVTQAAAADLSDYSTGTWTPALVGATIAGTFTYSAQVGSYERIGRTVIARFNIQISATSVAPTGTISITGLPVASANVTNDLGIVSIVEMKGITLDTNYTFVGGLINPNTSAILLFESAGLSNANPPFGVVGGHVNGAAVTLIGMAIYHT